MSQTQLAHIKASLEAHEELLLAVEDVANNMLNEKFIQRLREAMTKSRILIDKSQ